ncbi:LysR family transcriptional regulator [Lentzea sp. NPDC051838]|uniref:helix-turn-helix domain-containing protein n=1 Tax=Lentzea sp. NPDC051838 TaxID=3154849 RepID=UPI00341FDA08
MAPCRPGRRPTAHRCLRATADALGLHHKTLAKYIQRLERELGQRLLNRAPTAPHAYTTLTSEVSPSPRPSTPSSPQRPPRPSARSRCSCRDPAAARDTHRLRSANFAPLRGACGTQGSHTRERAQIFIDSVSARFT